MSVNDEFDLTNDLGIGEPPATAAKKPAAKPAKKAEAKPPVVDEHAEEAEAPVDPNKGKIRIMIDEVAGMSNYEVIGVNGKVIQVKRGVPVWVAPEYVHVLECAQMTHIEKHKNPMTGEVEETRKTFSAIPWRRV